MRECSLDGNDSVWVCRVYFVYLTAEDSADGEFYRVEDASDLPDAFDRVAENQSGIELTDTSGDRLPDALADMNLSMPSGEPIGHGPRQNRTRV